MPGWWKRFLKWRREVSEQSGEAPYIDVTPEKEQTPMASQDEPRKGGWLAKWRAPKRREQQLATLQEGFNELVDLTRAIRAHMDQQAQTQKTLVDMLQHIPGAVEGLQSVGKATEQQTETLSLLRKQLEAAARNEDYMMESMRSFNKTLTLMDEMSQRTSQTVSSMAEKTRDSEDMLRTILERSERRLVYMIVTLMVVTLTVLGVGLYIGFVGRPASLVIEAPPPPPETVEAFEYRRGIADLEEKPVAVPPPDEEEADIAEEEEEPAEEPVDTEDDELLDPEVTDEDLIEETPAEPPADDVEDESDDEPAEVEEEAVDEASDEDDAEEERPESD
jgi:hypothetical protein